jgi:hypothetical protein
MVEANIKIIEELKQFLEIVSNDPEARNMFTESEKNFTRQRKLTLERVAGIIINMPKRSLSIELNEFFARLGHGSLEVTKGAFSQQRGKLHPLFFKLWNHLLAESFYLHYGEKVERWQGFRLLAVDGSTAYLMDAGDVVREFGTSGNQHTQVPMARVMQVHDVLNDITVRGDIFPIGKSENSIMAQWVRHLYQDSLTLFDRGFPSYGLMYLLMNEEVPRHFVMRCKVGFNREVRQFVKDGAHSRTIELRPGFKAMAMLRENGYIVTPGTTIKVRMVRVILPTGETEVLLTNLYDEKTYPVEGFKHLYFLRWGIETAYGKQKNQQQMEQFSGHRAICIRQDYAAGLFTANLQALVEKQCKPHLEKVNAIRQYNYKVNRNISWSFLKHDVVKLFLQEDPRVILLRLQKAFERNLEPIRPGRQNPRKAKKRRLTGKYQTLTNYRRAI